MGWVFWRVEPDSVFCSSPEGRWKSGWRCWQEEPDAPLNLTEESARDDKRMAGDMLAIGESTELGSMGLGSGAMIDAAATGYLVFAFGEEAGYKVFVTP